MEETCLEEGPAVNFERATLEIANTDREFRRQPLGLLITIFNHFYQKICEKINLAVYMHFFDFSCQTVDGDRGRCVEAKFGFEKCMQCAIQAYRCSYIFHRQKRGRGKSDKRLH